MTAATGVVCPVTKSLTESSNLTERRTWCAIPFPVSDPYDPNLPWPEPPGWNWSFPVPDHSNFPWHASVGLPVNSLTSSATVSSATTAREPIGTGWPDGYINASAPQALRPRTVPGRGHTSEGRPAQPRPELPSDLPVDVNFWFFISIYYGAYLAVALIWITCLFNLYRRAFRFL